MSEPTQIPPARLRRPIPVRTSPRRNILGVFNQKQAPSSPTAPKALHPLGFELEDDAPPRSPLPMSDTGELQAASDLIDRHIRDGEKYTISVDRDLRSRFSAFASGIDTDDVAAFAKMVTQSYSELASTWVDLAGELRGMFSGKGAAQAASVPGPALVIQASVKVSASVQMFRTEPVRQVQPLVSETGGASISDVSLRDGAIDIFVPVDAVSGRYHGLILGESSPVGAITLTVPEPSE